MRFSMRLALALMVIVSTLVPLAVTEQNQKVLMIVKDHSEDAELMLTKEVGVMKQMLEQAGFDVVVATASGEPMVAGTATVKAEKKLADVNAGDYAGIVIPCMATGIDIDAPSPEVPQAAAIVKQAVAEGKPVAAQVSAVLVLAEAGVLSGKKYAYPSVDLAAAQPTLKNASYSGNGVIQDGKIITSGICPWAAKNNGSKDGTPALTKAFITELVGEK